MVLDPIEEINNELKGFDIKKKRRKFRRREQKNYLNSWLLNLWKEKKGEMKGGEN